MVSVLIETVDWTCRKNAKINNEGAPIKCLQVIPSTPKLQ